MKNNAKDYLYSDKNNNESYEEYQVLYKPPRKKGVKIKALVYDEYSQIEPSAFEAFEKAEALKC